MTVLDRNTRSPWLFDADRIELTPSLKDGISRDQEALYRTNGAKFIRALGVTFNLHYCTVATGIVFFHRFYMFYSFNLFPIHPTAAACLFLAGKAEETPKKSNDIIKNARSILTDEQFAHFGSDPKEEILTLERILLQTLRFDLEVEHPYEYLIKYVKHITIHREDFSEDDAHKIVLERAWTFINDLFYTTACLQYEPEIVAIAAIFLSCKTGGYSIKDWKFRQLHHKDWWDVFVENLDEVRLENICHQVLDVYQFIDNQRQTGSVAP